MSSQWQTVVKKKDRPHRGDTLNKKETDLRAKKKGIDNITVKVEDILTKSQVKSLYNNKDRVNKSGEEKKVQDNGNLKLGKKQEKSQEPKVKPPKTISSALKLIDEKVFEETFNNCKSRFPDAPIVWLKELAAFLNQRLSLELNDPVFMDKPRTFPLSAVPPGILNVIIKATKEANKDNMQLFFDISLTSMATDMSNNLAAIGHKLFLQYIAKEEPALVIANIPKHKVILNSYQNRSNIGLSILWAVGQVGVKDFNAGFTAFQEMMLPLIEMKNYAKHVIKYLLNLIKHAASTTPITKEQYLLVLDTAFTSRKNFPNELREELLSVISTLKSRVIVENNGERIKAVMEYLLMNIMSYNYSQQEHICDVIVECFHADETSMILWSEIYSKNISSSAKLLKYLDKNWMSLNEKLSNHALRRSLSIILSKSTELLTLNRKKDGHGEVVSITKILLDRMEGERKSRGSSKLIWWIITLAIASLVSYDILQKNWQDSTTRKALINLGVNEYTPKIINVTQQGLWWANDQLKNNFPVAHETVFVFSEPYIDLSRKVGKVLRNLGYAILDKSVENYPHIVASIYSISPTFVESSKEVASNMWTFSVSYINRGINYFKNEVFIGELSPENMQKIVLQAFNTTQTKASEYYYWLHEKIQNSIRNLSSS